MTALAVSNTGKEPAADAPRGRLPAVKSDLTEDFVAYRDRTRTVHERQEWLEIAREEIAFFTERLFTRPLEELEAIGAVYRTSPKYSPLDGFQSKLPQHELEDGFVKKFFYETLMTHKSLLTGYQLVEAAGFQGVTGKRFAHDHPLLSTDTARTFEDFGFPAKVPEVGDGVRESTSRCLASGGTFSWITHAFPSQYVMGSAMPDLWSDMSLAAGAKMLMIMITPCDGDVSTPERRLMRYRSAQDLIRRDPGILLHPDRDFELPSGERLGDFLMKRALLHLGAALKPGKHIADVYKPLIVDHGCRIVEVYDPGCTRYLLDSVRALRDRYGDSIEILAGRIPPDPDPKKFLAFVTELVKLRVTIRAGLLDGKICKTHKVSGGMAPMNFQTAARIIQNAEEIRAKAGHPVIVSVESGASERLGTAIAGGIAGVSISGSLAGTTLEHVPCLHQFKGKKAPYTGEAGEVTKEKGDKINAVGDPVHTEGASASVQRNGYPGADCLARRSHEYADGITKGGRFQRDDTIIGILVDHPERGNEIVDFSGQAVAAAKVHV